MRPAVIASVARNRKRGEGVKRIRLMSPQFSGRRFIVMIFVGTLIFAPGVALTVLGISNDKEISTLSPAHGVYVMYCYRIIIKCKRFLCCPMLQVRKCSYLLQMYNFIMSTFNCDKLLFFINNIN